MSHPAILDAFAGHAFLRGLSERHLMTLACAAQPFSIAPGEFVAREGATAKAFYLIQSGEVEIETEDNTGQRRVVQRVGPGEVVGWSWLLPPHRWQFNCRAVGTVLGIAIDAEWLRDQCEQDHELGYHLLRHLLAVVAERLAASRRAKSSEPAQRATLVTT